MQASKHMSLTLHDGRLWSSLVQMLGMDCLSATIGSCGGWL